MDGSPGAQLRKLLSPGAGVIIPGAGNALTARIIEQEGFNVVYLTGAGLANTYLGIPDMGLTTVTEVAANIMAIRNVVDLPIFADGDTGFGNALNMQRTIRLYEQSGANAIQIEDQVFPKKCGHFEGKAVIPREEMVQKITAAVDARKDKDFLIIARTDARAVEGFEATLARADSYREAGADLLFVEAPQSVDELRAIPQRVAGTHICNMVFGGKTPLLPRGDLAKMGYAGILYANAAMQSAMLAMQKTMRHLKVNGTLAGAEDDIILFDDRQKIVNYDAFKTAEKKYGL